MTSNLSKLRAEYKIHATSGFKMMGFKMIDKTCEAIRKDIEEIQENGKMSDMKIDSEHYKGWSEGWEAGIGYIKKLLESGDHTTEKKDDCVDPQKQVCDICLEKYDYECDCKKEGA